MALTTLFIIVCLALALMASFADQRDANAADGTFQPPILPSWCDVQFDRNGRIANNFPCRSCGYNIRGLQATSACPECGTSVEHSLRGDALQFSDPVWLGKLVKGILFIMIGLVSSVAIAIPGFALIDACHSVHQNRTLSMVLVEGTGALCVGLLALAAWGVWLLTTPDPGRSEVERRICVRRTARWGILAMLPASWLLWHLSEFERAMSATISIEWILAIGSALALLEIVGLIGVAATLFYLAHLARRMGSIGVATQWRIVAYGPVVVGILGVVAMAVLSPATRAGAGGAGIVAMLGSFGVCCVLFGVPIFGIWALVLLPIVYSGLKHCANEASGYRAISEAITQFRAQADAPAHQAAESAPD